MKTLRPILLTFIVAFALVTRAGAVGYWGRMYDPNLQRWIQRDPIGERGDINLYRFVANGPVNFMDPYGLSSVIITDTSGHVTILDNPSNAALRNAIASFASGSIDDVSIAGHGSHDFMALGKGSDANGIFLDPTTNQVQYDDDGSSFANSIKDKLAPGARIHLRGCRTAGMRPWTGKKNISNQLASELPGTYVIGSGTWRFGFVEPAGFYTGNQLGVTFPISYRFPVPQSPSPALRPPAPRAP